MRVFTVATLLLFGATAQATTFYITVAGLGGEPEYEQRFSSQAQELDNLLRAGGGDVKIQTFFGPQATKVKLQAALAEVSREAKAGDAFVLTLIGHASFDGFDYKINLPGPDITAVELATLTTVLSMNTIEEPRIVATSVQRAALGERAAAAASTVRS